MRKRYVAKRHEKRSADFLSAPEEVARALKEKFDVILVVTSSYVEGEPPDNILELFLACKRAHYATCQYKWAHELLLGERVLVARPRTVDDKSAWEEPREVACAAARETLKKYGKAALVGWAREAAEAWETALAHSA